jgi:hypothetical protein
MLLHKFWTSLFTAKVVFVDWRTSDIVCRCYSLCLYQLHCVWAVYNRNLIYFALVYAFRLSWGSIECIKRVSYIGLLYSAYLLFRKFRGMGWLWYMCVGGWGWHPFPVLLKINVTNIMKLPTNHDNLINIHSTWTKEKFPNNYEIYRKARY